MVGLFGNLIKTINWPQGALQNIFALAIFVSSNSIVQTGKYIACAMVGKKHWFHVLQGDRLQLPFFISF